MKQDLVLQSEEVCDIPIHPGCLVRCLAIPAGIVVSRQQGVHISRYVLSSIIGNENISSAGARMITLHIRFEMRCLNVSRERVNEAYWISPHCLCGTPGRLTVERLLPVGTGSSR